MTRQSSKRALQRAWARRLARAAVSYNTITDKLQSLNRPADRTLLHPPPDEWILDLESPTITNANDGFPLFFLELEKHHD